LFNFEVDPQVQDTLHLQNRKLGSTD